MIDPSSYRGHLICMLVGTKELKNRLSHYLRVVADGERVLVTDRGRVVAELASASSAEGRNELMERLAARELVTPGRGRLEDFQPVRLARRRRVSQMVIEDRG